MKMFNKEKGVTMVALVVTIIVMIILAGISINLTIGNNGIVTKAKQAKKNIEEATLNEQVAMNKLYDEMAIADGSTSDNISTDGIPDKIIEYIDAKLNAKMLEIYPVGSIYMSTTDSTIDDVEARFGGKWERYSSNTTLVGYDENGNKSVDSTGGNINVANIDISHTHTYDKTTSGSYATVISHNHISPLTWYDNGTTRYIGTTNDYGTINLDRTVYAATVTYNQGEKSKALGYYTSTTGSSTGSVSLGYTSTESGNMSANSTINAQDPYTVVYMYKRVE